MSHNNRPAPMTALTKKSKDVTVKQVTLNVTNMDKINIVSSQAVVEMSFFSMDTRSMSSIATGQ